MNMKEGGPSFPQGGPSFPQAQQAVEVSTLLFVSIFMHKWKL